MEEKELEAITEREKLARGDPIEIMFHPHDSKTGRMIKEKVEREVGLFYEYSKGAVHYVYSTCQLPLKDEFKAAIEKGEKNRLKKKYEDHHENFLWAFKDYLGLLKEHKIDYTGIGGLHDCKRIASIRKLIPK